MVSGNLGQPRRRLLTNGQLLGWELQITYPNTNPPTLLLTNGIVSTNTFVGPGTVYFLVTLPCSNTTVTNTLTGLLGGPFDLIFNRSMLPAGTGTGPGDVILLANSTGGTSVLTGGTPPLLLPGFYYLGVSSTNAGTNSFTLRIDFDSTNCTAFRALAACDSFSTNMPPARSCISTSSPFPRMPSRRTSSCSAWTGTWICS